MYIQSSSRYLQMINHGLMELLAPTLKDDQSKAVVAMLHGALNELYKREERTPELLRASNRKGFELFQALQLFLDELGESVKGSDEIMVMAQRFDADSEMDYPSLREINNQLNALLDVQLQILSLLRDNGLSVDQQTEITKLMREAADWDYAYASAQRENLEFEAFNLGAIAEGEDITLENLQQFIASQSSDEKVVVSELVKIPGGMAKHTYSCSLLWSDGRSEDIIVRKADVNPVFSRGACSIAAEYQLLKLVAQAGFNAPMPLMLAHNEAVFDADFFTMTKSQGIVPGNFFGPLIDLSEALLLDVAANMARLHSIDIEQFQGYFDQCVSPDIISGDIKNAYRIEIEYWKNQYCKDSPLAPSPSGVYIWDWLLNNIPDNHQRPVLVHGDFNIHNFLVEGDKVSAVLDWELAIAGDPAQDLAYIKPNIEKHIDWNKFMQAYYDNGGGKIDESTFPYYIAFANARPFLGSLHNMHLFREAENSDVRYPYMDTDFIPQFMKNILEQAG